MIHPSVGTIIQTTGGKSNTSVRPTPLFELAETTGGSGSSSAAAAAAETPRTGSFLDNAGQLYA